MATSLTSPPFLFRMLIMFLLLCTLMAAVILLRENETLFDFIKDVPIITVLVSSRNNSNDELHESISLDMHPTTDHAELDTNHSDIEMQHGQHHDHNAHIETKALKPAENHRKLYSSFVCIGGDTDRKINNYRKTYQDALIQHSCHFKNICYSNKQKSWLYYTPSPADSLPAIIQTEQYDIHYDFNTSYKGFLMTHSMKDQMFTPKLTPQAFPSHAQMHRYFDKTVVYHYWQWVYNFGHVLTDNYYSMYRALYYFHLYRNNSCCQALFNYIWPAAGFDQVPTKIPVKFITGLHKYLFNDSQPIFMAFDSKQQHGRDPALEQHYQQLFARNDNQNDLACFKNIVIGTDDFRVWWRAINRKFHHRWDFSNFIHTVFRQNALHRARYEQYNQVRKQKVLFISKGEHERRRWTKDTNVSYIVQYLQQLFDVEIDAMEASEIYNSRDLTQQIDFVIPYTLVITACGAVSYIGAFMRSGTAMITVDYWYTPKNITTHIDSYMWEYMNDRKTYYYYVRGDEWELPEEYHLKDGRNVHKDDVRNNADYRLKAPRLSKYVYSALLWIEHYNGWSDTFQRPDTFPLDPID